LRRIYIKALLLFKPAFHREEESQRKVQEGVQGEVYVYKHDLASGFCYLRVPRRCRFWTAFINLPILRKIINAEPDETILVIYAKFLHNISHKQTSDPHQGFSGGSEQGKCAVLLGMSLRTGCMPCEADSAHGLHHTSHPPLQGEPCLIPGYSIVSSLEREISS